MVEAALSGLAQIGSEIMQITVHVHSLHFTATPDTLDFDILGQVLHSSVLDQHGQPPDPTRFFARSDTPAVVTAVLAGDGIDVTAVADGDAAVDLGVL